jgi:hypothetical protein
MKKKKEEQSISDILKWCSDQEDKTKATIDTLLDTQDVKDKQVKKALTLAAEILTNVDKLKQETMNILTK